MAGIAERQQVVEVVGGQVIGSIERVKRNQMMDRKPTQSRGMAASLTAMAVALACGLALFLPVGSAPAVSRMPVDVSAVQFRGELDGFVPASVRAEALHIHRFSGPSRGELAGAVLAGLNDGRPPQFGSRYSELRGCDGRARRDGLWNTLPGSPIGVRVIALPRAMLGRSLARWDSELALTESASSFNALRSTTPRAEARRTVAFGRASRETRSASQTSERGSVSQRFVSTDSIAVLAGTIQKPVSRAIQHGAAVRARNIHVPILAGSVA